MPPFSSQYKYIYIYIHMNTIENPKDSSHLVATHRPDSSQLVASQRLVFGVLACTIYTDPALNAKMLSDSSSFGKTLLFQTISSFLLSSIKLFHGSFWIQLFFLKRFFQKLLLMQFLLLDQTLFKLDPSILISLCRFRHCIIQVTNKL